MEIIPAIDVIEGKCVRLKQGDYSLKKVYNDDPLDVAKAFEHHGITRLHLVDLDGAREQHIVNHKTLERIASRTSLTIDFGGGLKSDDDLRIAFDSGAAMVTGGSIAVKNRERFVSWLTQYGGSRIILGADVRQGHIAVSGWQEDSGLKLMPFLEAYIKEGVQKAICTDISKDGMLQGTSFELYNTIRAALPDLQLIASGGVTRIDELHTLLEAGLHGAIIGKAIYEGTISLLEIEAFILENQ